jgi:hypothetical protein
MRAGLPAVVHDLGAFAERAAGRSWTWVIPWNWDPDELIRFFVDIRVGNSLAGQGPAIPPAKPEARLDFYEAEYSSAL